MLIASLSAATAARATVTVGISQSFNEPSIFSHTWWSGLGITTVRAIVPYDIATRIPDTKTAAFDAWVTAASGGGRALFVVLGPSDKKTTTSPANGFVAPLSSTYTTAFQAFITKYGTRVAYIGAWNEPNEDCVSVPLGPSDPTHCGSLSAHVYLPSSTGNTGATLDGHTANNCASPTSSNCGSFLAANYYNDAARNVGSSGAQVVAGEFNSDRTAQSTYWQPYKDFATSLAAPSPLAWSIHGWHDIQVWGAPTCGPSGTSNCTTTTYRTWVLGKGGTTTTWDTEVGSDSTASTPGTRLSGVLNMENSAGLTRMYYYNFQQIGAGIDTGLVNVFSNGGNSSARRDIYKVICTRNGRTDPACNF